MKCKPASPIHADIGTMDGHGDAIASLVPSPPRELVLLIAEALREEQADMLRLSDFGAE